MLFGLNELKRIYSTAKEANLIKYTPLLSKSLEKHNITDKKEVAMFLAQIGHESGQLGSVAENLNYSAKRLREVWPSRFPTAAIAAKYEKNPEALANKVYADRMGNGNEASGDGWKYRGRGFIQLTGKSNYIGFANWLGVSLEDAVEHAETPQGAVDTAIYFWTRNNLGPLAREGKIETVTRKINGGIHGLADRTALYKKALVTLS